MGQVVPDRDTLLLMEFDGAVRVDDALGSTSVDTLATSTGLLGGRFGGGLHLRAQDRIELVGSDGNFHPPAGTIEFWVEPNWPGDDEEKHPFVCGVHPPAFRGGSAPLTEET